MNRSPSIHRTRPPPIPPRAHPRLSPPSVKPWHVVSVALGLALWLMARGPAVAMDVENLLPRSMRPDTPVADAPSGVPSSTDTPPADGAPDAPAQPDPDKIIIKEIKRIEFVLFDPPPPLPLDDPDRDTAGPPPPGVDNRVPALRRALADPESALAQSVRDILANPLTWGRLQTIQRVATQAARDYGWSIAKAYPPEQELTGGTLRLTVIPTWLADIDVQGARWTAPRRLQRELASQIGRPIHFNDIAAWHRRLSRNPFRRIAPAITPGSVGGSTRLIAKVQDQRPWTAFSGYETVNSRSTGTGRYHAGFTAAAFWWREHTLTMQYSRDANLDHLHSVSAVYQIPLPRFHSLTITGLWSDSQTTRLSIFDQHSRDYMIRAAYTLPLPAWKGLVHELDLGFEWRQGRVWNRFAGQPYPGSFTVIDTAPASLRWRGRRPDKFGLTTGSLELVHGFGDWFGGHMSAEAHSINRYGARPTWTVLRAELRRDWNLPKGFALRSRAWGQWTNDRLVDAAKFYAGGARSVRGYRESEIAGDRGIGGTVELVSPNLAQWFGGGPRAKTPPSPDAPTGVQQEAKKAPEKETSKRKDADVPSKIAPPIQRTPSAPLPVTPRDPTLPAPDDLPPVPTPPETAQATPPLTLPPVFDIDPDDDSDGKAESVASSDIGSLIPPWRLAVFDRPAASREPRGTPPPETLPNPDGDPAVDIDPIHPDAVDGALLSAFRLVDGDAPATVQQETTVPPVSFDEFDAAYAVDATPLHVSARSSTSPVMAYFRTFDAFAMMPPLPSPEPPPPPPVPPNLPQDGKDKAAAEKTPKKTQDTAEEKNEDEKTDTPGGKTPSDDKNKAQKPPIQPDVRLVGFYDAAEVYNIGPRPWWEDRAIPMRGAGLGLRIRYGTLLNINVDYAWRLRDTGVADDDRNNGFWHIAVNASF